MVFIQSIRVKSYLLKYLTYNHPTDPFVLTEKNRFGVFILNSLRFSYVTRTNKYLIKGSTEIMKIEIKEHYERSFGINLSPWHQYQFNSFLRDEFHDRMIDFVSYRYTGKKGEIMPALLDFCEKYDISEDDLPLKTIQKMWEREKHRLNSSLLV